MKLRPSLGSDVKHEAPPHRGWHTGIGRCVLPFDSPEAAKLNKQIFETIYFAALEASCEIAQKDGTYETYDGSPVSKGVRGV